MTAFCHLCHRFASRRDVHGDHLGDPTGATAEAGKRLFEAAVGLVAEQLVEISTFDFGR